MGLPILHDRPLSGDGRRNDRRSPESQSETIDLHLIFPPQWSPFQPFLSTPSLKAYLIERGHRIQQSDWNMGFYRFFINAARLDLARRRLQRYLDPAVPGNASRSARAIRAFGALAEHTQLLRLVDELRDPVLCQDVERFGRSVGAFDRLLDAFSTAEPVIKITSSSLTTGQVLHRLESLHEFTSNQEDNPFAAYFAQEIQGLNRPRYFGVSIIGTEQIVPGLTLCRMLKNRFPDVPIVVGGSVFSRLVEKEPAIKALFETYFDYICRYEGEQPMGDFLTSENPRRDRTPNIAFLEAGEIVMTPLCEPLGMQDLPTPDFTDLPLREYLTPELVLPLLSTRGCYWGKCAFCYHGMIYQDRYRMRDPALIAGDVEALNKRHGVRHFAFNDEALPPKLFRKLPDSIPGGRYFFTGLYKFEKYFRPDDFQRMYAMGFRSLYIGLESASERVQRHMLKNNLQSTMIDNLRGAHDAGIWNHTFAFFGFPTETEEEAEETIQFLLNNADIIHSEGTGTFSFEHNAPIHHDPQHFGVKRIIPTDRIFDLYYKYEPESGLNASQAERVRARFNHAKQERGVYGTGYWIPREHLLVLLSHNGRDRLLETLRYLKQQRPMASSVEEALSWFTWSLPKDQGSTRYYVVNRVSHQIFETNSDTVKLLGMLDGKTHLNLLLATFPEMKPLVQTA